jgi:S-DNA-T family DNA segregation ATPase FtsK/SpoIIIE
MAKRKARPGREGGRVRALVAAGFAQEGLGLLLIGCGLLSALALGTYDPADPPFRFVPVENAAGVAGASIARLLVGSLGFGAAVPVLAVLALGVRCLTHGRLQFPNRRFWLGILLVLAALSTIPALLKTMGLGVVASAAGGWLGHALAGPERLLLSGPGALVINVLALVVGAPSLIGVAPGDTLTLIGRGAQTAARGVSGAVLRAFSVVQLALGRAQAGLATAWSAVGVWRERRARRERVALLREPAPVEATPEVEAESAPAEAPRPVQRARGAAAVAPHIVDHRSERKEEPEQAAFTFTERTSSGPYTPPDAGEIFQPPPEGARRYDRDSLIMNSRILEKKLADFGVQGRVVTVHPGPVITMYEFEPAPGVKVNRITNLSDDLALALRALSIRIIAPIPGKSVVGIEVPNPDREVVYIRDLLESKSYRASASKLTLALGKDIFGNPVEADLCAMPHVLVAGATGTGKSVFLNSLLCSILCRATPDEVKLLLVDPKLLELSIYEGIPHLIADVVTNPKRAAAALQGIVQKMEERYQLMAALGVRNIAQFNRRVDEALAAGEKTFRLRVKPGEAEGKEVPYQRIPYIVVVIDELADLMVVSARDVEESLQRLAQMARASGIHLVLATQRPSVDVLTGVIKANFPARISFQVSSKIDSRTILDQGGAEHLLGQGDMLFLPPGTSKLQRLHGSFVSEQEVAKLVGYLRTQGTPRFDEDLIRVREEGDALEERAEDTDEHYDLAVQIVAESRNASISYIQRRLKVGYNRAARMIEQMEREGVVGPQIGVKPREVFIRPIGTDADVE